MFARSLMSVARRNFATIKVGDKFPAVTVALVRHDGQSFKTESIETDKYFHNKQIVLVGYPGAFTPTCQNTHVPEYIKNATSLKQQGNDEVIAMSVNDAFVTTAFAETLGGGSHVSFIADGNGDLTKALGLECDLSKAFLGTRCKRMSMVVKQSTVLEVNNEDGPQMTELSSCAYLLKKDK